MAENSQVVGVEFNPVMEKLEDEEDERKIPVFTVLKNSSILKNIYLIDTPPPLGPSSSDLVRKESHVTDKQEFEETLVVGRHPDCNITLEHPSISRFHLRIHSIPSRKFLSVIDLSSVHGTWICGKKIEPGVPVELQDGDILQLGGSSRIYKLHWIPLSHAYDYDKPFVPIIEGPDPVEEKEEVQQEDVQELSLQHDHLIQMEADNLLFASENIMSEIKQLTPSAPPMPEDMVSPCSSEEVAENKPNIECTKQQLQAEEGLPLQHGEGKIECDLVGLDLLFSDIKEVKEKTSISTSDSLFHEDMESPFSFDEEAENKNSSCLSTIADLKPVLQIHEENSITDVIIDSENSKREIAIADLKLQFSDSLFHEDMESPFSFDEEAENKNKNSSCLSTIAELKPILQIHEENSITDVVKVSGNSKHEITENLTVRPQLSAGMNIWNRRGKSASVSVSVQTSRARESCYETNGIDFEVKSECHENVGGVELIPEGPFACEEEPVSEVFTPDKENFTPKNKSKEKLGKEKAEQELRVDSMVSSMKEYKDETFTPDKENITPNTLFNKKLDGIRYPNTYRSSPLKNASSGVHQEVDKPGSSSIGRNHAHKLLQDKEPGRCSALSVLKSSQADRIPFQPLLKSPNSSGPETTRSKSAKNSCSPIKNRKINEPIHPFHEIPKKENKNWTMVADAGCLLNKDSRKALQLMQGLQGTSLIIPRIVIRELDCMKKRANLFRRKTDACSALEWIEHCMISAQSWIHVQSSLEDVRPMATTPPATPIFTHEIENNTKKLSISSSVPFSPGGGGGSWLDILSPRSEDHILECALFFRRINSNGGQLVLLSKNVTLKIKAMAEGFLCETAEEFRRSLVNPFSERFRWTNSSPRGPTWSFVDDVVLREKYYNNNNNHPIQKQSKSGEAGLKLILHHNSHFRQISSVR